MMLVFLIPLKMRLYLSNGLQVPVYETCLSFFSDYVTVWCRKNECVIPTETVLNDAITERISYARKQLRPKKTTDKTDKCS